MTLSAHAKRLVLRVVEPLAMAAVRIRAACADDTAASKFALDLLRLRQELMASACAIDASFASGCYDEAAEVSYVKGADALNQALVFLRVCAVLENATRGASLDVARIERIKEDLEDIAGTIEAERELAQGRGLSTEEVERSLAHHGLRTSAEVAASLGLSGIDQ